MDKRAKLPDLKFLNLKWRSGKCSEAEYERLFDAHLKHRKKMRKVLPRDAARLDSKFGLHDGIVEEICVDVGKATVQMTVVGGELEEGGGRGYFRVVASFKAADVSAERIDQLARAFLQNEEILHWEFHRIRRGTFEYRLAMVPPQAVASIAFQSIKLQVEKLSSRSFRKEFSFRLVR